MLKIDNLLSQFSDMSELRQFAEAQHNQIIALTQRIHELEEEKSNGSSLVLAPEASRLDKIEESDEEVICRIEIRKLRTSSMQRELTLDECRKLDTYAKILNQSKNLPKTIEVKARKLSTAELLALADKNEE